MINNRTYDTLRDWVEIYLPGLGTLYFALCGIWGFPYGDAIVGTIAALCAFLGLFLKKSRIEYNKLEDGVQDTFNSDSFTEMMGVEEDEDEKNSAEE